MALSVTLVMRLFETLSSARFASTSAASALIIGRRNQVAGLVKASAPICEDRTCTCCFRLQQAFNFA